MAYGFDHEHFKDLADAFSQGVIELLKVNEPERIVASEDVHYYKGKHINLKDYAIYLLREGTAVEKREFMSCIRSKFLFKNKTITLEK